MYQHGFGQKFCPSSARCPKVVGLQETMILIVEPLGLATQEQMD
jgi:hypothetical protein